jgi:hypothetical protein
LKFENIYQKINCTTDTCTPDPPLSFLVNGNLKIHIPFFRQAGHRYLCRQVETCSYQRKYGATVLPSLQGESGK